MPKRLDKAKRLELFKAWQEKQEISHVSRVCGVCIATCTRYRKEDKWDEKLDSIIKRAQKRLETESVDKLAYRIKRTRYVQAEALKTLRKHGVSKKQAPKILLQAIKLEHDMTSGQPSGNTLIQVNVNLPAELQDM